MIIGDANASLVYDNILSVPGNVVKVNACCTQVEALCAQAEGQQWSVLDVEGLVPVGYGASFVVWLHGLGS